MRYVVCRHIIQNCNEKNILLCAVNGYEDHLHCLILLGKEQSIAKVVQLIKGESSRWINQNQLCSEPFSWQDDYYAVSVSESQIAAVKKYIHNQESHHAKRDFYSELKELVIKYGFQQINDVPDFFSLPSV
jgi:putative transposase